MAINKLSITTTLSLVLVSCFFLPGLASGTDSAISEKKAFVRRKNRGLVTVEKLLAKSQLKPTIFYANTSNNCLCILSRCRAADPIIADITSMFGDKISIITINHFKQQEEFDAITATYPTQDLPVLLLFDKGQMILQQIGFLKKKILVKKINELLIIKKTKDL